MDIHELDTFIKEYQYESDRAVSALAVAYLEGCLIKLLQRFMVNDSRFIDEFILGDNANSLADNFSKRANLAFALGLLRLKELQDLNAIRKIQGIFNSKQGLLSFDDEEVRNRCLELVTAGDVFSSSAHKGKYKDTPRMRFLVAVAVLGHYLTYRAENEIKHREVFPTYD